MATDQLELAELQLDSPDCLEDVLRALGPTIRAVLLRKYSGVFSYDDIEDILATGLHRLWAHRDSFDPSRGSLKAWFFRITDNCARDILKHGWQKARQLEVAGYEVADAAVSRERDASDDSQQSDAMPNSTIFVIREILELLPEAQRKIVLADSLVKDETASSDFLAQELGLTASTVRVYRKRALDRIRRELEQRGVTPP